MVFLLVSIAVGMTNAPPGESRLNDGDQSRETWTEVLRGFQTENREFLREGRARMALHFLRANEPEMCVSSSIEWKGGDYLELVDVYDPRNRFFQREERPRDEGVQGRAGATEEHKDGCVLFRPNTVPKDQYMLNKEGYFFFSAQQNTLHVYPPVEPESQFFLNFTPNAVWLNCCPPNTNTMRGRPWIHLIGKHPSLPTKHASTFTIVTIDGDVIRQTRSDPDGPVLEIDFSLKHHGNVISFKYSTAGTNRRFAVKRGVYAWRPLASNFVLDNMEVTSFADNAETEVVERYRLKVLSCEIGPPQRPITKSTLLKLIPGDSTIEDHVTNKIVRRRKSIGTEELKRLTPKLKEKGFAKSPDWTD